MFYIKNLFCLSCIIVWKRHIWFLNMCLIITDHRCVICVLVCVFQLLSHSLTQKLTLTNVCSHSRWWTADSAKRWQQTSTDPRSEFSLFTALWSRNQSEPHLAQYRPSSTDPCTAWRPRCCLHIWSCTLPRCGPGFIFLLRINVQAEASCSHNELRWACGGETTTRCDRVRIMLCFCEAAVYNL